MREPRKENEERAAEAIEEDLEESLEAIDTRHEAEEVVERISRDAGDATVEEIHEQAPRPRDLDEAAEVVDSAVHEAEGDVERAVAAIEATAAEAAALEEDDPAAAQAIERAVAERFWKEEPEGFSRPRRLLLDAFLRHRSIPFLERMDAELFLQINSRFPHTPGLDAFFRFIALAFRNGYAWMVGIALFLPAAPKKVWRILRWTATAILVTSVIVEQPIKWYFQRRRPFLRVVRSVIIGSRPSSWSFPSGHSAAAFAGAHALGKFVPRLRVLWYAIASLVGFCRIYLGAHYPADVAIGGSLGLFFSELITRAGMRRR